MHNADSGLVRSGSVNSYDILDGNEDPTTFNQDNLVDSRVNAIFTESVTNSNPVYLGIRFYDSSSKSSGTTKYNTIMNTNWTTDWTDVVMMDLLELMVPLFKKTVPLYLNSITQMQTRRILQRLGLGITKSPAMIL